MKHIATAVVVAFAVVVASALPNDEHSTIVLESDVPIRLLRVAVAADTGGESENDVLLEHPDSSENKKGTGDGYGETRKLKNDARTRYMHKNRGSQTVIDTMVSSSSSSSVQAPDGTAQKATSRRSFRGLALDGDNIFGSGPVASEHECLNLPLRPVSFSIPFTVDFCAQEGDLAKIENAFRMYFSDKLNCDAISDPDLLCGDDLDYEITSLSLTLDYKDATECDNGDENEGARRLQKKNKKSKGKVEGGGQCRRCKKDNKKTCKKEKEKKCKKKGGYFDSRRCRCEEGRDPPPTMSLAPTPSPAPTLRPSPAVNERTSKSSKSLKGKGGSTRHSKGSRNGKRGASKEKPLVPSTDLGFGLVELSFAYIEASHVATSVAHRNPDNLMAPTSLPPPAHVCELL